MKPEEEKSSKVLARSQGLYEKLLAAYPREHREEYGAAMAQLFRDQSRDAWRAARRRGLLAFWLRIVPDLVKTSVWERLMSIKGGKLMLRKMLMSDRSSPALPVVFLAVFAAVFLFVSGTCALVTFILPKAFASHTTLRVASDATPNRADELRAIQSDPVLDQVITKLDLSRKWTEKNQLPNPLTTLETRLSLKMRLDVKPVRNTSLVEITVYDDDPVEAADIANAVARNYQDVRMKEWVAQSGAATVAKVELVDTAMPEKRPVRPNVPLNLFLGGIIGIIIASAAGGLAVLVLKKFLRKPSMTA